MRTAGSPLPPASADPSALWKLQAGVGMQRLRRAYRRSAFTLTAALVGTYVLDAATADLVPGFMALRVAGPLNIGLLLVLLQSGAIVWAAWWSGRYAKESLDPLAESLRRSIDRPEGGR